MKEKNKTAGYQQVFVSNLVTEEDLLVTRQLPKVKDEVFSISFKGLYLSPTGEVQLGNLLPNRPIKLFTRTGCYRREIGYGRLSKGLIRTLEFEKLEIFEYQEANRSDRSFRTMMLHIVLCLRELQLAHRIVMLSARNMSYNAKLTVDFEVYLPKSKVFMEISSLSNCGDFQCRRSGLR
ncbi:MAG: hypothetical protein GY771_11510 [bacterium]|nr:hypothetical protein [bacterium]